jgi:Calcineurin-like phosphoesterase
MITRRIIRTSLFLAFAIFCGFPALAQSVAPTASDGGWRFAVSGDSRNCGDVVMPGIAVGVKQSGAAFYWHLGDFRAIYDFDEDMRHQPQYIAKPLTISQYLSVAWDDFIQNQIVPFGTTPVFLGIGNHDTTPPKTREQFLIQFADWLDQPVLLQQRLSDDPRARKLTTYFHWIQSGVDFISLDNATADQFDFPQMTWFEKTLQLDIANPQIHTIVVAMHEALPDSISENHAMDQFAIGIDSGRRVYADLLKAQNDAHKRVYVLASHSHYYMDGIFNTRYWREHGGVLPGWIIGTAGAVRYALPPEKVDAKAAATNVYGFLLGTIQPSGEINFTFQQLNESDVPATVVDTYKPEFVHWCFAENSASH